MSYIQRVNNFINAYSSMDMNPLWKELLLKKNSQLTDQDRLVIDSNPELWWYRQKVNAANKVISELEKRNRQLKKEYENLIKTEMNEELWLPADINQWSETIEWALSGNNNTTNTQETDQRMPGMPIDYGQYERNLEHKNEIEARNPNYYVDEQWRVMPKDWQSEAWAWTSWASNTIDQALGWGWGWWASNTIDQALGWGWGWGWWTYNTWTGGSWESQFGNAMWTLAWSKKQIMSSADEQLQWAAMAANKEAGYMKWLATRTGSSFGEAKLADDRANALYRAQAADIKWQRDQNLAAIDQNIAWVQQQLGSTQAQMAAQQMAARSSWGGWGTSMSEYMKLLTALQKAWWWGNEVEADPENPLTEDELKNINEAK